MKLLRRTGTSIITALAITAPAFSALACPKVGGLIDFNCNGRHRIVGTGDSFVVGVGDDLLQPEGGYIVRLKNHFPDSEVVKLGLRGATAHQLLKFYKEVFSKEPKGKIARNIGNADILVLDIGRNGYFSEDTPEFTATTIRRLAKFLADEIKRNYGYAPIVGIATEAPTTRGYQRSFVADLNNLLLKTQNTKMPPLLRFDELDPIYISWDGLHPSSAGHRELAKIVADFVGDTAQTLSRRAHPDRDLDGIDDLFERPRTKTDPRLADTDSDGLLDGEEFFLRKTNPRNPDTDADGLSDGEEVAQGTDPLNQTLQTPMPTTTATEVPTFTPTATPPPTITATPTITPPPTATPTTTPA